MNDSIEPNGNEFTDQEKDEYCDAWDNATLEVDHWFSLPIVAPTDAALLLCQH